MHFIDKKNVYDVTEYIKQDIHPAKNNIIIRHNGLDVYNHYNFHSKNSKKLWDKMKIGKLIECIK